MLGGIMLFAVAGVLFLASGLFTPQKAPRRMTPAEEAQYDLLAHIEPGTVTFYESTGKAAVARQQTKGVPNGIESTV